MVNEECQDHKTYIKQSLKDPRSKFLVSTKFDHKPLNQQNLRPNHFNHHGKSTIVEHRRLRQDHF